MNTNSHDTPISPIQAFLSTTRNYLGLPAKAADTTPSPGTAVSPSSLPLRNHMKTYRKNLQSLFLIAGLGAICAGPVLADPGCDYMNNRGDRQEKMMARHHNQLHDALKLSQEQEAGWQKLMNSEPKRATRDQQATEDWTKLSAPERAEKMLERSKQRQAQMADHVVALKAFYATLSPEQQKTFDGFHPGPRGRMNPRAEGKPGSNKPQAQ